MTACYPEATIATLLYDPVGTEGRFAIAAANLVPTTFRGRSAAIPALPAAAAARRRASAGQGRSRGHLQQQRVCSRRQTGI